MHQTTFIYIISWNKVFQCNNISAICHGFPVFDIEREWGGRKRIAFFFLPLLLHSVSTKLHKKPKTLKEPQTEVAIIKQYFI